MDRPLLFIIFNIDLPNGINFKVQLYADDRVSYMEINYEQDVDTIKNDLDTGQAK